MVPVFVLLLPWAHFDLDAQIGGVGRERLSADECTTIPAGVPIRLAAPESATIKLSGHRMGVNRESSSYLIGAHRYRHFIASVGTRPEDNTIDVEMDGEHAGTIIIKGHQPRPGWTAKSLGTAPQSILAEALDHFLLRLIDLIRIVDDPKLQHHQSGWERLCAGWSTENLALSDPPMSLIVRHAKEMRRLLTDLAARPRRILRRRNAKTNVDRVQQLDTGCIRWLSRQPGREIYERAGPRQQIMAVRRYETRNTLENRVLRDFCRRSRIAALTYTERYDTFTASDRWKDVDRYGRECGRSDRSLGDNGILLPHPPIIPNYALLQERRYRKLWHAYRQLLKHMDEEDECWRWQHRLWIDFCRLAMQVSLRTSSQGHVFAESPLRLSAEQQRGSWITLDNQSAVFHLTTGKHLNTVISVIWNPAVDHPKLHEGIVGLGASSVLHVQSLDDEKEALILVWPIHSFGENAPQISDIVASADNAGKECVRNLRLSEDVRIKLGGIVMQSSVEAAAPAGAQFKQQGSIVGLRFGTTPKELSRGLNILSKSISTVIDRLFWDETP